MLASVNLADRLSVDVQGAQSLRAKAASGDPEALRAAAKQFEAMFVQIMLKTMRETKFTAEGDTFGDSNNLKMYQELLDQQWSQKMVGAKGLGFADAIVKRLGVEAGSMAIQEKFAAEAAAAQSEAGAATRPADAVPLDAVAKAAPVVGNEASVDAVATETSATSETSATDRKSRFISAMLPHARKAEAETGVPARFILAHAALESGWGQREIPAEDGSASHNLFGIKATGWSGPATEIQTTEYRQGLAMKVSQRFRAYADYGEGFTDYAKLLQRRYGAAVASGDDAEAFASGLANGGYATDPAYAEKIRQTIASVSARMDQV